MQTRGKTILLILFLVILWAPFLQGLFNYFPETELKGAYVEPEKPEFVLDSFLTSSFQKKWEAYEDYNFGFRGALIKLKNGIEYILFKEIDNADIIEGRNGFLYSYGSAERTMRGVFYNGKEKNENTIAKIKFLKEQTEKRGGHFLVVIAPSKESVIPENLPSFYDDAVATQSDYRDFVEGYQKNNIPYIDLPEYFRKIKNSSPYQLFTKTGFHWSTYGASIAQDTILKYCQSLLAEPMPSYIRKGVEWSDTPRGADADFEEVMNLPFSLQQSSYVYPKIEMIEYSLKNKRPKVIIIGDSFFRQIKNLRNLENIFLEDSQYWYYFKKSMPLIESSGMEMEFVDIIWELENADFVILLGSMGTLGEFPFGVADYYDDYYFNNKLLQDSANAKRTFYLKAGNGKYVCADGDRNNGVFANRDTPSRWETFSLFSLTDNKCAISSYRHTYLSAELGQQNEITANRSRIGDWEAFSLIRLNSNHVAFKAANGKYLTIDEETLQLYAIGNSIGKQEKFEMMTKP